MLEKELKWFGWKEESWGRKEYGMFDKLKEILFGKKHRVFIRVAWDEFGDVHKKT